MPAKRSVRRTRQQPRVVYVEAPRRTVRRAAWGRVGGDIGARVGSRFGSVGRSVGRWAGRTAGRMGSRIFGSGAYTTTRGSTKKTRYAPQTPSFTSSENGNVIIHREYLGDIYTSGTAGGFKIESYGLNPGDQATFPWLSGVCQTNYQQYKFEGLVFEFKSMSADALNSVNTALGAVFACINYDYNDDDIASRYEVENTDWASSCKPSQNMLIPVEVKPRRTGMGGLLYVLNSSKVPAGADPKTFFLGKLWIGTTGFQGTNVNIGSLYVTYKVRLLKPVMLPPLSNALVYLSARQNFTLGNLWGTQQFSSKYNCDSIGVTISGDIMTIDPDRLIVGQRFMVFIGVEGASTANVVAPDFVLGGGLEFVGLFPNTTTPYAVSTWRHPAVATTSAHFTCMAEIYVRNADIPGIITLIPGGTFPLTPATGQIYIFQISGAATEKIGTL